MVCVIFLFFVFYFWVRKKGEGRVYKGSIIQAKWNSEVWFHFRNQDD